MSAPENVIIEEIIEEARTQTDRIIRRAKRQADRTLKRTEEDLQKEADGIRETARKQAAVKTRAIVASIDQKVKQRLMMAREDIITRIRDDADRRVLEIVADPARYREMLVRSILDAVRQLRGEAFQVRFREEDDPSFTGQVLSDVAERAKAELDRTVALTRAADPVACRAGCVVVAADGRRLVDQTLDARFERLWAEVRQRISPILFPHLSEGRSQA